MFIVRPRIHDPVRQNDGLTPSSRIKARILSSSALRIRTAISGACIRDAVPIPTRFIASFGTNNHVEPCQLPDFLPFCGRQRSDVSPYRGKRLTIIRVGPGHGGALIASHSALDSRSLSARVASTVRVRLQLRDQDARQPPGFCLHSIHDCRFCCDPPLRPDSPCHRLSAG
jgi:hypothetical protein